MRQGCGHLRLIDLGSTTGALFAATLPLPGGYQGIAFFLGHLSPHLVDLAARKLALPTLSLVEVAILSLERPQRSRYQQKCQRQKTQQCKG
jgi:hypothetical protein